MRKRSFFVIALIVAAVLVGVYILSSMFIKRDANSGWNKALNMGEDKVIGSTFKTLAKTFVVMSDIDKIKKSNLARLNKMKPDKFKKQYAKAYVALRDLPDDIKATYKITEDMSKEQAIINSESLDKQKIYEIIDAIPDAVISGEFKKYLSSRGEEVRNSGLVEQVTKFWNKSTASFTAPVDK